MSIFLNKYEKILIKIFSPKEIKIPIKKISGKILVFKCASWSLFHNIISSLQKNNNNRNIYALGFKSMKQGFKNIGINTIFFENENSEFYVDQKVINQINNSNFDYIIIPINNQDKSGYDMIKQLSKKLNGKKIWISKDFKITKSKNNFLKLIFIYFLLLIITNIFFKNTISHLLKRNFKNC